MDTTLLHCSFQSEISAVMRSHYLWQEQTKSGSASASAVSAAGRSATSADKARTIQIGVSEIPCFFNFICMYIYIHMYIYNIFIFN